PLQLRDDARPLAACERSAEAAQRLAALVGRPRELGGRDRALRGGHLVALGREDVVEDAHRGSACVASASAASFARAAPEAMLVDASARPAPRSSAAAPPTQSAAAAFTSTRSRRGPLSPASTARTIAAFSTASPPRSSSGRARALPPRTASRAGGATR